MKIVSREYKLSRHPEYELYAVEEVFRVFNLIVYRTYHGDGGFYFTDLRKASVFLDYLEQEDELKRITLTENIIANFIAVCILVFLLLSIIF